MSLFLLITSHVLPVKQATAVDTIVNLGGLNERSEICHGARPASHSLSRARYRTIITTAANRLSSTGIDASATDTLADYLFISSWANGASSLTSTKPNTLTRSTTPTPSPTQTSKLRNALPLPYRLVKSKSFAQLRGGAPVEDAPPIPTAIRDDTVMDTRTPSPVQKPAEGGSGDAGVDSGVDDTYQPDLSKEVAMLSTKLVNAINYQTNLDDSLQASRHELERAHTELSRVKAEKQSLDDAIAQGILVKKSEVEKTMAELRAELAKEKARRETAERAKRQTDAELETLTANLFEEANNMVAEARKDTEAVERRNSQLKGQIKDTEVLLASQQEQLQDLKLTMEKLERLDTTTTVRDGSLPSTPINSATAVFDAMYASPGAAGTPTNEIIQPDQPLHFTHLLHPVLRTDISAYTDFVELLNWARWARNGAAGNLPHSRNASGNQQASTSQTNLSTSATSAAASMSSPNLPGAFSFGTNSANNSPSSNSGTFAALTPPLKESKFYKRALVEDLEPTLRLDLAPGLSFLSRRTVTSALLNGTLTIEPFTTPVAKFYSPIFACSLCGESRKTDLYQRRHRFRTSENDDAARYPLCGLCLERVRSSAEFVGFLRMVRDGHWRCFSEEEDRGAWGESVRLRERMFWARIGGGVVPALVAGRAIGMDEMGEIGDRAVEGAAEVVPVDLDVDKSLSEGGREAGLGVGREGSVAVPEYVAQGHDDVFAESGIGSALVSMASRAVSTGVPTGSSHAHTNGTEAVAGSSRDFIDSRREEDERLPELGTQLHEESSSQQDAADADAQLQREASTASTAGAEEAEMQTPPEMPFPFQRPPEDEPAPTIPTETPPVTEVPRPQTPEQEPQPSEAASTPPPRPTSQSSLTVASTPPRRPPSQSSLAGRSPSPSKSNMLQTPAVRPGAEERRPSSSVLDRVRAMEGK